ncbi:siderophore-interacting protein [Dyadobacter sp. CY343]|uniref:siderophore-interacting protein n=1 Tax=Dyadobacter sp. CY343 TaxID=2907299 RepID=UPI001F2857B2|nr:siderophore-interacting protein [Dyadobacter sp. CY343]MCE7059436.1 siderophore-interacting protein [Dyadobacter sp. CY343]
MVNIFKKAASGLMERMLSSGTVTSIRKWQPGTLYEVELHIPHINMEGWDSIKRLKCKVDELEYRDYTPVSWNSELNICTLLIDGGHDGAGSRWVRALKPGDPVLFGAAHAASLPSAKGRILGLADASALGHFLALKQLTDQSEHPMEVGVLVHGGQEIPDAFTEVNPEFEFLKNSQNEGADMLEQWYSRKALADYNSIYIAGNIPMMKALKRKLKSNPRVHAKVYGHGFWS